MSDADWRSLRKNWFSTLGWACLGAVLCVVMYLSVGFALTTHIACSARAASDIADARNTQTEYCQKPGLTPEESLVRNNGETCILANKRIVDTEWHLMWDCIAHEIVEHFGCTDHWFCHELREYAQEVRRNFIWFLLLLIVVSSCILVCLCRRGKHDVSEMLHAGRRLVAHESTGLLGATIPTRTESVDEPPRYTKTPIPVYPPPQQRAATPRQVYDVNLEYDPQVFPSFMEPRKPFVMPVEIPANVGARRERDELA